MLALSLLLLLPACGYAFPYERYGRDLGLHYKRQTATCDSTYGEGSEPCGGDDSTYCFNPNQGQTCCATDRGFCEAGKYCAPVAGYCCAEGEDLSTCAKNAGFVLPDDSVHDSSSNMTSMGMGATSATTTAESTVVGTMTVIPLVRQSSAPTATDIQNVTCGFATSASSMMTPAPVPVAAPASPAAAVPTASTMPAMPTLIQHTNATAPPPLVEVSFAARRASPLAGLRMMVGVVGVLGLFF